MSKMLMRTPTAAAIAAGVVLVASCGEEPTSPSEQQAIVLRATTDTGLEHIVHLTPAQPSTGDTLVIMSVIRNGTDAAATVTARICGFDLDSEMATDVVTPVDDTGSCRAYSTTTTLTAGDSIQEGEYRRVTASPGIYLLRVRHLLEPELWLDTPLVVRGR